MVIQIVDEYKAGMRDGRCVYIMGEKVEEVTMHPMLGRAFETLKAGYKLCVSRDPAIRDLHVAQHPEAGESPSRFFITPRTTEDLALRP
ncbi:MAG TPA: hypothetical protein ENN05_08435 [Deltaproteobacteria bacterium]|nr:hypothetical protein [Deltaproteobacteria bacterium]